MGNAKEGQKNITIGPWKVALISIGVSIGVSFTHYFLFTVNFVKQEVKQEVKQGIAIMQSDVRQEMHQEMVNFKQTMVQEIGNNNGNSAISLQNSSIRNIQGSILQGGNGRGSNIAEDSKKNK
jgi:hypothetical protein